MDIKAAFFKTLIEQAKSIAIPIQNLELIFSAIAKYINSPARWVLAKLTIHKETQTIDGFPHIRRGRAQKDL